MKKILNITAIIGWLCFMALQSVKAQGKVPIIPAPQHVQYLKGNFTLEPQVGIQISDSSLDRLADYLSETIQQRFDIHLNRDQQAKRRIILKIDPYIVQQEAYDLEIKSDHITISGSTDHGIFNGISSLMQLCYVDQKRDKSIKLKNVEIQDAPRFGWRGFMVDESRHFFGKKKIKQLLDLMALFKLNTFHWHLTDEPGWRIEIKGYPKLTTIGARGNWSDPDAPDRFYTQDDIREIVAYARDRFIKVVPEIDMPGHASAANLAYPEFSGGGSKEHPDFTYNPGRAPTYQYLTNILREINFLFPSGYIHIGGDEVHFGNENWLADPDVKDLMQQHNLQDAHEMEAYFIRRMADSVHTMGNKVVGWDELSSDGVDLNNNILMWWRHDKPEILHKVLKEGYQTILCPRIPMYFDFVQHDSHQWGRRWDGFSDLKSVYEFPSKLDVNISDYPNIMGIQANLWTETVTTDKRFDFMIWPRLAALAEAAWTRPERKSYASFKKRLPVLFTTLDTYDIYYFNPLHPKQTPEPAGVNEPHWQEKH